MTVRTYKELTGKTNRDLTKEFKAIQPEIDEPLVSRMVSGLIRPSNALEDYIDEMAEKVFANRSDGFFEETGEVYRPDDLTPTESRIFDRLEKANRYHPVDRHELCILAGVSDRVVRRAIESIRRKGGRVCTSSQHYGYSDVKVMSSIKDDSRIATAVALAEERKERFASNTDGIRLELEALDAVYQLVCSLDGVDSSVLLALYYPKKTYYDAARCLGYSVQSVSRQRSRAIAHLVDFICENDKS